MFKKLMRRLTTTGDPQFPLVGRPVDVFVDSIVGDASPAPGVMGPNGVNEDVFKDLWSETTADGSTP